MEEEADILSAAVCSNRIFSLLKRSVSSNRVLDLPQSIFLLSPHKSDAKMTTVLVVDDSKVSRLLSKQYILNRHPDWIIAEAASGEEAIDKLQTVSPDLVLLDLNMPGMGGLAAVEKIQAKCPTAHITLLTANVQDATREKANALGIGFAEKPITEARIDQIIAVFENQ
jgi:CheY-like chemotaxis protein